MLGNIENQLLQLCRNISGIGMIDGMIPGKTGQIKSLLNTQSVKFYPGIFPGVFLICTVGGNLVRKNKEALSASHRIAPGNTAGILGSQNPCAGYYIMKKIVIADMRSVRVKRAAGFPTILV
jgi:hypothetical protein